ncbi:MAG: hypothetical protein M1818_002130 [Claussenomyces sp. TS43310]|nr:MAG: hypothetical protein M1818_002130 [Claussenomyces sp. TS43310]
MTYAQDDDPPNVLDLPQVHAKPSYDNLIHALEILKLKLPSWKRGTSQLQTIQDRKAAAAYLTKIISSPLSWLDSEEQRETLWDEASKRLAERSGRSGDNLGLKTWASSYLLAKRLENIYFRYLGDLPRSTMKVLELGSGTGLVGLAAAAIWRVPVWLTDLPEIIPNLARNVESNEKMIKAFGGAVSVDELDWNDPPSISSTFQIILAADPLYSPDHAPMLARTIDKFLDHGYGCYVIIELPLRDDATRKMKDQLLERLGTQGFELFHQGEESGFDDWEENSEVVEVNCWWGIWRRTPDEQLCYQNSRLTGSIEDL